MVSNTHCADCGLIALTWAEQRRQFAREIQCYGLTPEEAKQTMPRCGKCLIELVVTKGSAGRSAVRNGPHEEPGRQ